MLQQSFDPFANLVAFPIQLRKLAFEPLDMLPGLGQPRIHPLTLCRLLRNPIGLLLDPHLQFDEMRLGSLRTLFRRCPLLTLCPQQFDRPQNALFECLKGSCLCVFTVAGILEIALDGYARHGPSPQGFALTC
jgi:hypothetical protein